MPFRHWANVPKPVEWEIAVYVMRWYIVCTYNGYSIIYCFLNQIKSGNWFEIVRNLFRPLETFQLTP